MNRQIAVGLGIGALSVLVVVLPVVAYFTWQSIAQAQRTGSWTYSQLITEAQYGDVATVVIDGQTGLATDRSGHQYIVTLPPDTRATAKVLTGDGVNVSFRQPRDAQYWVQVLVPNVILLLLVGAGLYGLFRLVRKLVPGVGPSGPPETARGGFDLVPRQDALLSLATSDVTASGFSGLWGST